MRIKKYIAIVALIFISVIGFYLFNGKVIEIPVPNSGSWKADKVEEVYSYLNTDNVNQAIEAIYRLYYLDPLKAYPILTGIWKEGKIEGVAHNKKMLLDPRVRAIVASLLIEIDGAGHVANEYDNYIYNLAKSNNDEYRAVAATAMGSIGGTREVPLLGAMAKNDKYPVAVNAILSLKRIYINKKPGMPDSKAELMQLSSMNLDNALVAEELKRAISEITESKGSDQTK